MEKSIKQMIIDDSEGLIKRIQMCNSYQRIYKKICDSYKSFSDVYENSPAFISIAAEVIINSLLLELIKLFDKNDPTKPENNVCSMVELINECKENLNVFPNQNIINEIINEAERRITGSRDVLQKLRIRRNKTIAHNDYKCFLNTKDFETVFSVKWKDIEELLTLCSKILYSINSIFTGQAYLPYYENDDDVVKLLESAHIGLLMRDAYINVKMETISSLQNDTLKE